jgi:hypothetical protein
MPYVHVTKVFGLVADSICGCVTSAELTIRGSAPDFTEAMEDNSPEFVYNLAAGHFASLTYLLMRAESLFELVRQPIRGLYVVPPEPLGDVSGPSFHDMGLRYAESVFTRLQTAGEFNSNWTVPIRGATEERVKQRATEIGQMAEVILPRFWKVAPRCDAQRLRDCIETEATNAVKAWHLKMRRQQD